jgi:hypothetical protein
MLVSIASTVPVAAMNYTVGSTLTFLSTLLTGLTQSTDAELSKPVEQMAPSSAFSVSRAFEKERQGF